MKAISTFVSLFLIITTAATSAVLYLNENFNFLRTVHCLDYLMTFGSDLLPVYS